MLKNFNMLYVKRMKFKIKSLFFIGKMQGKAVEQNLFTALRKLL